MDKKSRNTIIISIVALAIVLITVTYAYFSARITGIESASTISLTAGRMEIVYTEGNEILSFNNIYPREEAWVTKTFTLTGYNTTELNMQYNLGINVEINTFRDYLTYDLTLLNSTGGVAIPNKSGMPINGTGFKKIGTGSFTNANGDTHNYELKIYFKDNGEDQNDAQGAIFNGSVSIGEKTTQSPANNYTYNGTVENGTTIENTQYEYHYNEEYGPINAFTPLPISNSQQPKIRLLIMAQNDWYESNTNGWAVKLRNVSEDLVNERLYTSINNIPLISMSSMFEGSQASSIDFSSFDTSNVINMQNMFSDSAATSLDLSSFDTSNVTNMAHMFANSQATTLDLSSFDTSNVTDMSYMFYGSQATSIDLSSFDTSNVIYMENMFDDSQAMTLDLSSFDTSNVINMSGMFANSQATTLDLSSFDTSNVMNMAYMFSNSAATTLDLSSFDMSNVTNVDGIFHSSLVRTIYARTANDAYIFCHKTYSSTSVYVGSALVCKGNRLD